MSTIPLTPAQHAILDKAIHHSGGRIDWFPDNIKGGARKKVLDGLFKRALITPDGEGWKVAAEGYDALGKERPHINARSISQFEANLDAVIANAEAAQGASADTDVRAPVTALGATLHRSPTVAIAREQCPALVIFPESEQITERANDRVTRVLIVRLVALARAVPPAMPETIGGNTPVVGDRYFFAHPKVAAVVVTDSAGSSATLTAGTHYTVDTDFGALQFLDISGFTAPFKAAYTYGAATEIGIFTQALPERYLRLEGINTAQGNAKVLVELYRVAFDPLKEISFISDEYNKFELEGSLLADTTKPYDALLGQFGRIVQL